MLRASRARVRPADRSSQSFESGLASHHPRGDHDWFLGGVGQWQEHCNFECATHSPLISPLIIAGPRVKQTSVRDRFVETVDISPTILDCVEAKPFPLSDGRSLMPLLSNPLHEWKECAYHIFNRGTRIGYAVRTETARYVEWHQGWGLDSPIIASEFYCYSATQPDEVRNEAADQALEAKVKLHVALLRQKRSQR